MPYLVQGTVLECFSGFGNTAISEEGLDDRDAINLDLPLAAFLGNQVQAKAFATFWEQQVDARYYVQGNMTARSLLLFLTDLPLKPENEMPDNMAIRQFAYINDSQEPCGLTVLYHRDDPTQWLIGFMKNTHALPHKREMTLLSSFDLAPYISKPEFGVNVYAADSLDARLMQQLDAEAPRELLNKAFAEKNNAINVHFERINFLMRKVLIAPNSIALKDPIDLTQLNVTELFAENPALDLLVKHDISLSSAMLKECLRKDSLLCKELNTLKLTAEKNLNKHLLNICVVFYEHGLLAANRHLLDPVDFIRKFQSNLWNSTQIKLVPLLASQSGYDDELIHTILSTSAYYNAVERLKQLNLTQNIPTLFKKPESFKQLLHIENLAAEDEKKLCLIFWYENELTVDAYAEIIAAMNKYPLLAATLVTLYKTGTVHEGIKGLYQLAINPEEHLKKSIEHHFFPKETEYFLSKQLHLHPWSAEDLVTASKVLTLLKSAAVKDRKIYCRVLENKEHFTLGRELRAQFSNKAQLQEWDLESKFIVVAAQENFTKAKRFKQIVEEVEEQCTQITKRLHGSASSIDMHAKWVAAEADYRKTIYELAYSGILGSNPNWQHKLKAAEQKMLDIVEPPIDSFIRKALIVIANIVISLLTGGLANYLNGGTFFNGSRSGKDLNNLGRVVRANIDIKTPIQPSCPYL